MTQDKIILEPCLWDDAVSEVQLMLGTRLKLVPEDCIPEAVAERGNWNNYLVYLPVRTEEGRYEEHIAAISQHEQVSVGFLPMTGKNILTVAFSCLGDRYGWGGMLGSLDCSLYTRNVYRCFGLNLPRDTGSQASIPGFPVDISQQADEEKAEQFADLPAGSILYFPGHVMIYLGTVDGSSYVISATGSLLLIMVSSFTHFSEICKRLHIILHILTGFDGT